MNVTRWLQRIASPLAICAIGAIVAVATHPAVAQPPPKRPKLVRPDLAPEIAALNGTNDEAAARAATNLGTIGTPAAHEALLDALAMGLRAAPAIAAVEAVAMVPAPADVASIVRYANHRNPSVRAAALGALAKYPDPIAKQRIAAGLRDLSPVARSAAAAAAAKGRVREAIEPLFALFARGDEPAARALAAMADADLVRQIADRFGKVPDASLALALGLVLLRPDVADSIRVDVVRALAKIQHESATRALAEYVEATPKQPARASRDEAEQIVTARGAGK